MRDQGYEMPTHEFRVWSETGDLVGYATVFNRNGWHTVESHPFSRDEKPAQAGFRSESAALSHAERLAEGYKAQAIDEATAELDGPPVGVMSDHGYSIQIVEYEA